MARGSAAITGMGVRSPLGGTAGELFDALLAGRSGVRTFDDWDRIADLGTRVGAPVPDFDPRRIPRKHRRTMGRCAMFGVVAAEDAARAAGLADGLLRSGRVAAAIGSTVGSTAAEEAFWREVIETGSARGIRSTHFLQVMSHTVAANVAMYLGLSGPMIATNAACASSNQAIGAGLGLVRNGDADAVLAGGADELHVMAALVFDVMGGASASFNDRPEATPRPFDRDRDGIVVGEGAGILVIEDEAHARARGASPIARVLGYGATSDAVNMAHPAPEGMARAVRLALEDAGVAPEDVDWVCAHATGTPVGDAAEAEALYGIFGDRVPVSSLKGHLGHTLGACGGIEAVAAVEAMRRGVVPGTRNLEHPDVAPLWLPSEPVERPVEVVVSTNFAFGGVNTAVVLGRAEG